MSMTTSMTTSMKSAVVITKIIIQIITKPHSVKIWTAEAFKVFEATHFCRCYYTGLESNIVDNVEFFRNIFNSIETLFLSLADGVNIVSPLSGNLAGLF